MSSKCTASAAALALVDLQRIADRNAQALRRNGLDDEIEGAGTHGRDHRLDAALPRLHDDGNGVLALGERVEEGRAVHLRHHQVEQDHVDQTALAIEQIETGTAVFRHMGDMAGAFDHVLKKPALDRIVIDDKNMGRHWNLLAEGARHARPGELDTSGPWQKGLNMPF